MKYKLKPVPAYIIAENGYFVVRTHTAVFGRHDDHGSAVEERDRLNGKHASPSPKLDPVRGISQNGWRL